MGELFLSEKVTGEQVGGVRWQNKIEGGNVEHGVEATVWRRAGSIRWSIAGLR
jgi:hypothetical protein